MTSFEKLYNINVNDKTEDKNGLTYLSWAWAWAEFKKAFPDAEYEVKKFENGLPYVYDENTGYMVFTSVTVDGLTHEMWLPVMDGNNKAMKNKPYEVQTKYKKFTVNAATMFDINKTIMRCLTKNLAMFGLGLYIYAGEDLPDGEEPAEPKVERIDAKQLELMTGLANEKGVSIEQICKTFGVATLQDMTKQMWVKATQMLENTKGSAA